MRLVRFQSDTGVRTGVLDGDEAIDAHAAMPRLSEIAAPGDLTALLVAGDALRAKLANAIQGTPRLRLGELKLLAPLPKPPKIVCCWVNYLEDGAAPPSEKPIFFGKFNTAIIGPGENIRLPRIASKIVVEPELTAVIGKPGKDIAAEEALSHVAGYTIVNDVTAFSHRLIDLIGSRGPNMMAKTFDTFAPMGPCVVTSDEVPDPHALRVRQWLNESLEVDSSTSQMVTKLPEFLAYLSSFCTLESGDLVLTGSPKPLGKLKFLAPGDAVTIEIERIGVLRNSVIGA